MAEDRIPQCREVRVGDRVVGVYDYGDPDGEPVLTLHGTPACGAGFAFADEPASRVGLHVIAPDRPGVGRSSPAGPDGWTVAGYASQVADLADALGIDRFAVWGYSGGGPYAVACAAVLSDRVTAVAVTAGMGQMGEWAEAADFEKTDRQLLGLSVRRPRLARMILATTARLARRMPKTAFKSFDKELSEADRAVVPTLGTPQEAMALFTQACTDGARGCVDDYRALSRPWDLDLAHVQVPMVIWHGDEDTMVPLRHSEQLAERVPSAELRVWPGAGHLGTISHVDEILAVLARGAAVRDRGDRA